jgi:hypothetical protein
MPRIKSANPDSGVLTDLPNEKPVYSHGMATRQTFIPMAFQVTSPFSNRRVLMPHALVMHVNPQNYSEAHTKKIERIQTRGGFVEQHWGDDLTEITADGSTGAFMNIYTGLTSLLRQRTIAWDRYRDLHDLFRNNGSLYDPYGNIVLQGNIMLMYDRGTYLGYFRTFSVEETDDQPFSFKVSWNFKVEQELMKIPNLIGNENQRGTFKAGVSPAFQGQNAFQSANTIPTGTPATLATQQQAAFESRANSVYATAFSNTGQSINQDAVNAGTTGVQQATTEFAAGNVDQAFQTLQTTHAEVAQIITKK